MATKSKIKGICKGIKFNISQIFVVKEREIEIGHPTDVKHVAHIGWDGPSSSGSGSAPSWMNDFKPGPDFSLNGSIGEPRDSTSTALSTWSSQDFDQSSTGRRTPPNIFQDFPPTDMPNIPKKHKRKKTRPTSSEKNSASSARPSRVAKAKAESTSQIAVNTTA